MPRIAWTTGNYIATGEEAERERVSKQGEQLEPGKVITLFLYGESDGV